MNTARVLIALIGVLLPFAVRLLGGIDWLRQYTDNDPSGLLFISAMNAPPWLTLLGLTFLYRTPVAMVAPCVLTFGFLAWANFSIDLLSDAQAAIGLVFFPILAIPFLAVGALVGYVIDRARTQRHSK